MPIVFLVGILCIALEDKIQVNKGATALLMAVSLWSILLVDQNSGGVGSGFQSYLEHHQEYTTLDRLEQIQHYVGDALIYHLGDVSGTIFFILCTMLLIDIVDRYGGFLTIAERMHTVDKRRLLWRIAFLSFFFSAMLDNLAAAVIVISILRKLVPNQTDRLKYACIAIIACNAGGSWSPIGDVTTLLLWSSGRITPVHQILHNFVPALVNMLVPLIITHFWLFPKGQQLRESLPKTSLTMDGDKVPLRIRMSILAIAMLTLILVPLLQSLWRIPAFLGVVMGLAVLWLFTELVFRKDKERLKGLDKLRINNLMHDADLSTIFYFLGVLLSVASLEVGGQLEWMAEYVRGLIPSSNFLAMGIGVSSSLLDNVALVAATMGMYPLDAGGGAFALDGSFWTFLAYCAVTGGSLLIIGSATGVTIMGLERISFRYYLQRFTGLALLGYLAGAGVSLLFFI